MATLLHLVRAIEQRNACDARLPYPLFTTVKRSLFVCAVTILLAVVLVQLVK